MPNQAPDQIPEDTEQLEGGISATNAGSTSDYTAMAKHELSLTPFFQAQTHNQ